MNHYANMDGPRLPNTRTDTADHAHCRLNPLSGEWVFVSQRSRRVPRPNVPFHASHASRPAHDPDCPFCRAAGDLAGEGPFANGGDSGGGTMPSRPANSAVQGETRAICFSRRHDRAMPDLSARQLREVVDLWVSETAELGKRYNWVHLQEDRGALLGQADAHPHVRITGMNKLPPRIEKEERFQRQHFRSYGANILNAYSIMELSRRERVVFVDRSWVALVPFWAHSPFETMLLPRRSVSRPEDLTVGELDDWAESLRRLSAGYERLFGRSFPYKLEWLGAAGRPGRARHWQLHVRFYPPDLKSMAVRQHWSGCAFLEQCAATATPETAASCLAEAIA